MADEVNGVRRVKSEHLGIGAIIFAVVTGGTGLGLNVASNKEVIQKVEALTIALAEFRGAVKASDERAAKLEVKVDRQQDVIDRLKDDSASLRETIHVLEAKLEKK